MSGSETGMSGLGMGTEVGTRTFEQEDIVSDSSDDDGDDDDDDGATAMTAAAFGMAATETTASTIPSAANDFCGSTPHFPLIS